jgi:hypothetical protein
MCLLCINHYNRCHGNDVRLKRIFINFIRNNSGNCGKYVNLISFRYS